MMGMEKMLANMIGMTPDQMRAMAEGFSRAANEGAETLKTIQVQQGDIIARLERIENGKRKQPGRKAAR
jgi:hypothetical protein